MGTMPEIGARFQRQQLQGVQHHDGGESSIRHISSRREDGDEERTDDHLRLRCDDTPYVDATYSSACLAIATLRALNYLARETMH